MRTPLLAAASLATFFLSYQPASSQAPLASQGCAGCHGQNGAGSPPIMPLAGRPQAELEAAMRAFRNNERPNSIMARIARGYTEAEITALATHFAAQRPQGAR